MTAPSSRPDTPAQEHADTVRAWIADYTECDCDEDSTCLIHRTAPHLDALLKEVERLTAERDEWLTMFDGDAHEWFVSLPSPYTFKAADFTALVGAAHALESRAEAAERERDEWEERYDELLNAVGGVWPA